MAHNLFIFIQNWTHPQAEIFMHLRYEQRARVDIYWRMLILLQVVKAEKYSAFLETNGKEQQINKYFLTQYFSIHRQTPVKKTKDLRRLK